jgi:hypothetical protein
MEMFSYTKIMWIIEGTSTIRNVKNPQQKSIENTNYRPQKLLKRPIFFPFTMFVRAAALHEFMILG